jgi:hypothetical protein
MSHFRKQSLVFSIDQNMPMGIGQLKPFAARP